MKKVMEKGCGVGWGSRRKGGGRRSSSTKSRKKGSLKMTLSLKPYIFMAHISLLLTEDSPATPYMLSYKQKHK